MTTIIFKGLNRDDKRISFTGLLTHKLKIGLKEAKVILDRIVDGEIIEVSVPERDTANEIIIEATNLGFNCKIK